MSRSNPLKKKKRQAKKTLLMFGEGLGEEMFLKHLRGIYSFDQNVHVDIKRGKGGDACGIVVDAAKVPGAYDRKVVVLDNDKSGLEMSKARQEAKTRKIELLENTPCLEYLLLSILSKKIADKKSAWCKNEFESNCIEKKKRSELKEYIKIFPKALLDNKRLLLKELDKLISIISGE